MKKKILFIIEQLTVGGAEVALLSLLNSIDYSKYDIDLFLFYHKGELMNEINENINLLPVSDIFNIFDISLKNSIIELIKSRNFRLIIDRVKYSLLFRSTKHKKDKFKEAWKILSKCIGKIDNNYDTAIGFVEGASIRLCVDNVVSNKKIGWIHSNYVNAGLDKEIDKLYFRKLDNIVTVSQSCKDILISEFPSEVKKIRVIYNITPSLKVISLSKKHIMEQDNKFNFTILTVGRLCKVKGYDLAIEACEILKKKGYKIKWYVIGEGNERNYLQELIKNKNIEDMFKLLGLKKNPYPYMKMCDLYCQPSRSEGYATTVTEAKILNKPIILTNYDSAKEQIINNKNGLIVEMNAIDIANGIEKLINDKLLREKFSKELSKENDLKINQMIKIYEIM